MTEHDAALAFDQALDGAYPHDLNGAEPLVQTARTVQSLFDRQHAIPSEEFIMQLEGTLFPTTVVPTSAEASHPLVVPTGVEGPPAAAVARPQPLPRPARVTPDIRRISHSRLVAIAAVLALVIGGMGAIIGGPFDPRSTPEPSAIPAASFGTVEATPEPIAKMWTVAAPERTENGMEDRPPVVANGIAFRTFASGSGIPMQAVDLQSERVLWETVPRVTPRLVALADELLLVAGGNGKSAGFRYELIAIDGRTGEEQWSEALPSEPVGLKVLGDQIIVLGSDNLLESFDLQTQEVNWQIDLSRFVDSLGELDGLNRFTDTPDGRLAILDGVIGALLSNGRLVAVDATDGRLKWSDERRSIGWTRVAVVDGQFVVIAFGKATLPYDPEATPLPFAPFDPAIDPCRATLQSRSGVDAEAPPASGETVDSFDPETGTSSWGLIAQETYSITPTNVSRLIVEIGPGWDASIANNNEDFTCSIDVTTGVVSETTANDLATFVIADTETGELHGLGATPSGIPIWIAHVDSDQAATLPYLDLDLMQAGGLRYVREADDLILITTQNGTLIGLPKDAPSWSSPNPATPEAMPNP